MSCLVVANALESGNDLDLDQTASRKGGNLEGAARGERGLKLGGVDLVHGGEVGDVGQVDRGLDDIGKGSAGSGQQAWIPGEYGPMAAGALSEDTTVLLMFFSLRSIERA